MVMKRSPEYSAFATSFTKSLWSIFLSAMACVFWSITGGSLLGRSGAMLYHWRGISIALSSLVTNFVHSHGSVRYREVRLDGALVSAALHREAVLEEELVDPVELVLGEYLRLGPYGKGDPRLDLRQVVLQLREVLVHDLLKLLQVPRVILR